MSLNWPVLVSQNRAKAHGIPWSDEEAKAIFELKIPADFVRQGVLTLEDYSKAKSGDQKKYRSKQEIQAEARSLGIEFTELTTRPELLELIEIEREKRNSSLKSPASP